MEAAQAFVAHGRFVKEEYDYAVRVCREAAAILKADPEFKRTQAGKDMVDAIRQLYRAIHALRATAYEYHNTFMEAYDMPYRLPV